MKTTVVKKAIIILFIVGLALHIFLAAKYWIGGDQAHLLRLGMKLAEHGVIEPFGKLATGVGLNVGCLLQFLVGIPLKTYPHFRSPMILIILFHIIAYFLLSSVFRKIFGEKGLLMFTIIYWMSPLRIYNSGFLWEPSYIFLPAAVHLWTSFKMNEKRNFWLSALHFFILICARQIHNSFLVLILATGFLVVKKKIKVNPFGAIIGIVAGLAFFIPIILAVVEGNIPPPIKESSGYLGRSFVMVWPFLKGIFYWFKIGCFDMVHPLIKTMFETTVMKVVIYILQVLSAITVLIGIYASWRYFRPLFFKKFKAEDRLISLEEKWLRQYALFTFYSLAISAALSPTVLQSWQVMVALHAGGIPVIAFGLVLLKRIHSSWKRTSILAIYIVLEVSIIIAVGFGQPRFNRQDNIPKCIRPNKDSELLKIIPYAR